MRWAQALAYPSLSSFTTTTFPPCSFFASHSLDNFRPTRPYISSPAVGPNANQRTSR